MTRDEFESSVDAALRTIPRSFRQAMQNIAVVVEDEASPQLLEEVGVRPPGTLLGLYQGIPLPERGWGFGNTLPDRITLFQRPIEAVARRDGIERAIWETLVHEIGHYFGMSEAEIEEVETQYWHHQHRREP